MTAYCAFLKTYASFRVVGQRRRHVDHFRFLLSFSTLAYNNRAYSTCPNFASWKFRSMLPSIRRGPLSFFRARTRILSKAAGWFNALFRRRRRNKNFNCTSVNLILYHTRAATDVVTTTICCCV